MYRILNKIYRFTKYLLNKKLISYLVKHKMIYLLSLLFIFSLKKIKIIKPKSNPKYRVIVLSKSGGVEDLIESQKRYNKDILFLSCKRHFFKIIFQTIYQNYSKSILKKNTNNFKIQYYNFLSLFLKQLKKQYNFKMFIGFNFNYYAEQDLHKACTKLKIPFLLLFKESVLTELEKDYFVYTIKKKREKFNGYKVAVYSKSAKEFLIKSNIINKNKIEVIGCSRLSISHSYKNVLPSNQILYYAIQGDRGLPNRFIKEFGENYFKGFKYEKIYNKNHSWKELHLKTLKILKKFANENPNISIIIKTKTGEIINKNEYVNLPKNIKLNKSGVGHNLLIKSKVVIAWNTTSILEAIAANRFILLPYFHKKNKDLKKRDELILNLKNRNYGYSEKDFYKKLNFLINKNYKKEILYNNLNSIEYYLGNKDNNADFRLNKFIKNNLNFKKI